MNNPTKTPPALLKLTDLHAEMQYALAIVDVVREALETGDNSINTYVNSIFGAYSYLTSLHEKMGACIEALREEGAQG